VWESHATASATPHFPPQTYMSCFLSLMTSYRLPQDTISSYGTLPTLMTSLTPSRVSWASGMHSLNHPFNWK